MKEWNSWEQRFNAFLESVNKIGGEAEGYLIKPPASLIEVSRIEKQIGLSLPKSLVKVITEYSSGIEMVWSLPDEEDLIVPLPKELRDLYGCSFSWNLNDIPSVEADRKGWETEVFPNPEDSYESVWHEKLAFIEVGNGDYFAFDLSIPNDPPVVYLSHDDGEGHGYILGNNFIDFFNKWTQIGCVGCEDWQLLPFIKDIKSGIDPSSNNAITWRTWLNVNDDY